MRPTKRQLEPTLRTKRLVLRPIAGGDLDAFVTHLNEPGVTRMLGRVPLPYKRKDAEEFLAKTESDARSGRGLVLVIEREGSVVGCIGISDMPKTCEFGYWIARAHWGKGFATEASQAVLAYGFDALGLTLLRSGFYSDNRGSRRVQAKVGFHPVGISRRRSLARAAPVEHIDTVLSRARFLKERAEKTGR
jgi:RimJ/RimL family protein N-acetyltransferase